MNDKSKVDFLLEIKQEKIKQEKEEIKNLKLACKEVFSDVNGKFFLKFLKKICGWNDQDNNINPEMLIYKKGRRDIWAIIRNIVPKDVLAQVEIYDDSAAD